MGGLNSGDHFKVQIESFVDDCGAGIQNKVPLAFSPGLSYPNFDKRRT
jgi:hypothetical protein